jgi:hypothetical protein
MTFLLYYSCSVFHVCFYVVLLGSFGLKAYIYFTKPVPYESNEVYSINRFILLFFFLCDLKVIVIILIILVCSSGVPLGTQIDD